MATALDTLLARVEAGELNPVFLVTGDRVVAEPAALRLAEVLAKKSGGVVESHRRPPELAPLLADLRTYSLFGGAKVVLAVETGVLADRSGAAWFIDQAAEVLPVGGGSLSSREREGALRLLQVVRLFDLDPYRGRPEAVLAELPEWVFQGAKSGGRGGRAKKDAERLRGDLAALLTAALEAGLEGRGTEEVSDLAAAIQTGLPPGHVLILAESEVAADHPIVATLDGRGAFVRLATIAADRDGAWRGLEGMVAELTRETGVTIAADAIGELARRTLKKEGDFGDAVDPASTARFAGEYRKLASLAHGSNRQRIERHDIEDAVEDRGQEDVWAILDAISQGRGAEALDRYHRLLATSEDEIATRLSFFSLFAGFCRNLAVVPGLVRLAGVPAGESSYPRFKERIAPALQKELDGEKSPLAGLHPFRLHKAYLAASRRDEAFLARLPWRVLETEMRLKGESDQPDVALAHLMAEVAGSGRGR